MGDEVNGPAGLSRRSMLKRSAAVGGALVWAVPVVETIGQRGVGAASGPAPTMTTCQFSLGGHTFVCTCTLTNGSYVPSNCIEE